jgi:hypothetical protein
VSESLPSRQRRGELLLAVNVIIDGEVKTFHPDDVCFVYGDCRKKEGPHDA